MQSSKDAIVVKCNSEESMFFQALVLVVHIMISGSLWRSKVQAQMRFLQFRSHSAACNAILQHAVFSTIRIVSCTLIFEMF